MYRFSSLSTLRLQAAFFPLSAALSLLGSAQAESDASFQGTRAGKAEASSSRSSQQGEESVRPTAGHDGSFYVGSADGKYTMRLGGLLQGRFIANFRGDESGRSSTSPDDNVETGFEFRRIELGFSGNIADVGYQLVLATEDGAAGVEQIIAQDVRIDYALTDNWKVAGGRYFAPFLREELIGGGGSLAVALSYMNNTLSIGRGEGLSLLYEDESFRTHLFFSDGAGSGGGGGVNNPFSDGVDWAVTARSDFKFGGDWGQWGDYTAAAGASSATFIGAAVHYQMGESGDTVAANDVNSFMWTVDASTEWDGLNIACAIAGNHTDPGQGTGSDMDDYGIVVQGGYMGKVLEPFLRYESLSFDEDHGYVSEDVSLVTLGANYHATSHFKVGCDVVWALDPMPTDSLNAGLLADGTKDNQVVIRIQGQLKF